VQDAVALIEGCLSPPGCVRHSCFHHGLHLLQIGQTGFTDADFFGLTPIHVTVSPCGGEGLVTHLYGYVIRLIGGVFHPALPDFVGPLTVGLEVKVGIGFVFERVGIVDGRLLGLPSVLLPEHTPFHAILQGKSFKKLVFQVIPLLAVVGQVERIAQEVFLAGILVHTAYQIGHGIEKMLVFNHGRVQDDLPVQVTEHTWQVVGHSFQHLKRHVIGHVIFLTQKIRITNAEKVVRSDSHVQHLGVFRQ